MRQHFFAVYLGSLRAHSRSLSLSFLILLSHARQSTCFRVYTHPPIEFSCFFCGCCCFLFSFFLHEVGTRKACGYFAIVSRDFVFELKPNHDRLYRATDTALSKPTFQPTHSIPKLISAVDRSLLFLLCFDFFGFCRCRWEYCPITEPPPMLSYSQLFQGKVFYIRSHVDMQ